MTRLVILALAVLSAGHAYADQPAAMSQPASEAAVMLTQAELSALISSENAKAVAAYVTQQEAAKAKTAYDKIRAAFFPSQKKQD